MSNFYDDDIAEAIDMIEEFGQSVTWRKLTDGALPNTTKPWEPGKAKKKNNTVSIVFLPDTRDNRQSIRYTPKTEIVAGSELGLMGAVSFTPVVKDTVIRDGVEMVVKSIDVLRPNGTPILYTMEFEL